LRQKLKKWGRRKKTFFLLCDVIVNAQSTSNSNISANSKLYVKTLWDAKKTVAQGKVFDEKNRGRKSQETVPLTSFNADFQIFSAEGSKQLGS
jgi:hypothetical protein